MKFSRKRHQFLLMLVDLLILIGSVFLALLIRNASIPAFDTFLNHLTEFTLIIIFWLIAMYTLNMYSLDKLQTAEKLSIKLAICAVLATMLGFSIFYLFSADKNILPKTVLVIYGFTCYVLLFIWRVIYNAVYSNRKPKTYIFMGATDTVKDLIRVSKKDSYVNFKPVAIFDLDKNKLNELDLHIPSFSNINDLIDFANYNAVKIFVLPEEKNLVHDF